MKQLHGIILAALFVSGCAGFGQVAQISDLSTDELKRLHNVRLLDSDNGIHYTSLGRVKGLSCKGSWMSGDTKQEAAMTQLKMKAVQMDANAVLYPTCSHDASVDWGNNCWESWVCVGEAVRVK